MQERVNPSRCRAGLAVALAAASLGGACEQKRDPVPVEARPERPAPERAVGPVASDAGTWVVLDKDGRFHAAICALGPKPEVGAMFSPEHSATRDPAVAREVPCPPPIPAVAAPARGQKAISLAGARLFAPGDIGGDWDGIAELVAVEEPGPERSSVLRPGGGRAVVENARLVALEASPSARPGQFVLALHPDVGLVRAVIVPGRRPTAPKAVRLRGFGTGLFGAELSLPAGSFRVIGAELDPGSLVAIPLADRIELGMVLAAADALLVTVDESGRLRALHRSGAAPLPIALRPRPGAQVYAPFASSLDGGKATSFDEVRAELGVVWDEFPDSEPKWFGAGCYTDRDLSLGLYRKIDL
jgi:hypothetical protein